VKRFGRGLVKTIRQTDWLDRSYLVFMVGAGVLFGAVMDFLMGEFKP
jgi:hypothetical protein